MESKSPHNDDAGIGAGWHVMTKRRKGLKQRNRSTLKNSRGRFYECRKIHEWRAEG
jgi:hypothetical protein